MEHNVNKVTGTGWLGHVTQGLDSMAKTYLALNTHLSTSSHQNAKAEGLAKLLLNKEVVACMVFLRVIGYLYMLDNLTC